MSGQPRIRVKELRVHVEGLLEMHRKHRDQEAAAIEKMAFDSSAYAGAQAVKHLHAGAIGALEAVLRLMDAASSEVSPECPECNGGRVRVYPGTPIGHTETCRRCKGSGLKESVEPR